MKCTPDKNDPFSFEGPEIYKCKVNIVFNFSLYVYKLYLYYFLFSNNLFEKYLKFTIYVYIYIFFFNYFYRDA